VDTFAKRPGFAGLFSFLGGFLKHHFGSLCRNHMPRLWPRPPRPCRSITLEVCAATTCRACGRGHHDLAALLHGDRPGLLIAPFVVAYKNPDPEKLSAYECGFNAFDDARMKFDVRFYLVAILFIIFDLEVAFLFPVGASVRRRSAGRLLVDDGVPGRADHRLHLRMEEGSAGMGLMTEELQDIWWSRRARSGIDPGFRQAGRQDDPFFRRNQRRAGRQGLSRYLRRRADQLGAHRFADVDDLRSGLLRGRDDADVDAALRRRALRHCAARLSRASRT
jgi:hypothetical protein